MQVTDVLKFERRQFPRLKAPSFFRSPSIFGSRSRISDISLGGFRVYSDYNFKKGRRLEIEIFVSKEKSIEALVRVVWIRKLPQGSTALYDVGLEFIKLPHNAFHDLIKSVLADTLLWRD